MNSEPGPEERTTVGETARVLKMWREMAGLTQRELAEAAGIHYTTISDYENGKSMPYAVTIARLTAALGMTQEEREVAEVFVRQTLPKLRVAHLDEADLPSLLSTSASGEVSAWRKRANHVVQDGTRFFSGLLLLVFNLLISIAEALRTGPEAHESPGRPQRPAEIVQPDGRQTAEGAELSDCQREAR